MTPPRSNGHPSGSPAVWWVSIRAVRLIVRLLFRLEVRGRENLPVTGPAILAANHTSYLDPPIVAAMAHPRPVSFMAKHALFKVPVLSPLIRRLYAFPVDPGSPDRSALAQAGEVLRSGRLLGIFPEGTRIRAGAGEYTAGVALIASQSGAPVVPIAISGAREVWRGGALPIALRKVRVSVGVPFTYAEVKESLPMEDRGSRALREAFTSRLEHEVRALHRVLESER